MADIHFVMLTKTLHRHCSVYSLDFTTELTFDLTRMQFSLSPEPSHCFHMAFLGHTVIQKFANEGNASWNKQTRHKSHSIKLGRSYIATIVTTMCNTKWCLHPAEVDGL